MTTAKTTSRQASPAAEPSAEAILCALDGRLPRVPMALGYRAGLLLAALFMLLLPVVYLGIIALVLLAVFWHMAHDGEIVTVLGTGRGILVGLFLYVAPLVIGSLLVIFMVKPIFARSTGHAAPMPLSRSHQYLLYAFVDRLCTLLGAPKPCRIDVDCRVNASASFRSGLVGFVKGELVLTIGLPLAGGLTLQQFAGVLAHEFGHFSQGTGMRLTYVVRRISGWLARMVYERDEWDQWLNELARSDSHWTFNLVGAVSKFLVWLTRRVLWCLLLAGHLACSFLLRQMEFDADRHQVGVAGSSAFAGTFDRIRMLNLAQHLAFGDLEAAWRERRLCDDLTHLVVSREEEIGADLRASVGRGVAEAKTGWFDSHPCDREREESALRQATPGVFRVEGQARLLFHDFAGLSRNMTRIFYHQALGEEFSSEHLISTQSLNAQRSERQESQGVLQRFFQGVIDPLMPVFPDAGVVLPEDGGAEQIVAARSELAARAPAARKQIQEFHGRDTLLMGFLGLQSMRYAGLPEASISLKDLGIPGIVSDQRVRELASEAESHCAAAAQQVRQVGQIAMQRINLMLAAERRQRRESTARNVPESDEGEYALTHEAPADSGDRMCETLLVLQSGVRPMGEIRREYARLEACLRMVQPEGNSTQLISQVLSHARKLHAGLMALHECYRKTPYPYEHREAGASIARYALRSIPNHGDIGLLRRAAQGAMEAIDALYLRLMSDLAARSEKFEQEMGLEVLPEPAAAT